MLNAYRRFHNYMNVAEEQSRKEETRKEKNKETRKHFKIEFRKLPDNIRNIRKAYGEKQEELGLAVNVTKATISKYEAGRGTPELTELMAIAHHYGLTIERLIYGDYDNNILNDEIFVFGKRTRKLLLDTLFEKVDTEEALKNEHFREAYEYHLKMYNELLQGIDLPDTDTFTKCDKLYSMAASEGVIEAVVNRLWCYMYVSIIVASQVCRLRSRGISCDKNSTTPELKVLAAYRMPAVDDNEDDDANELYESKEEFLDTMSPIILSLIRTLKQSTEANYRDLADYYIALMYRYNFRTDAYSPEENYAIGAELITIGCIMENPYAMRHFKTYNLLLQFEDRSKKSRKKKKAKEDS